MQCPRCKTADAGPNACQVCGLSLDWRQVKLVSSMLAFETGQPVGSDLAIIEYLGGGLTGLAYKVQDTTGGEIFILKFVTVEGVCTEHGSAEFRERIGRLQAAPHPGIGVVREIRDTEFGFLATVSELNPGDDLARRLEMRQEFDPATALRIGCGVGDAVAHAHALGVLHMNLRPSNVILTPGEAVKVIDFAIRPPKLATRTHPYAVFLAPETVEDPKGGTQASDVYSLGGLLYQLITGRPPTKPAFGKLSQEVKPILERALQSSPKERYGEMEEMLGDLARAVGETPSAKNRKYVEGGPKKAPKAKAPAAGPVAIAPPKTVSRPVKARPAAAPAPPLWPKPEPMEEPMEEPLEEPMEEPLEEPITQLETDPPAPSISVPAPEVPSVDADSVIQPAASEEGEERKFPLILQGHKGYVHAVAAGPDSTYAVSGASDSSIRVWRLADQSSAEVLTGHRGYVYSVKFAGDPRRLYSVGMDGHLRVWDILNPQDSKSIQAHPERVFVLAVDPDRMMGYTSGQAGGIRVWNLQALEGAGEIPGHQERVYALALSHKGKLLASGSKDKTIRLWDTSTKKEVAVYKGHKEPVYCLAFAPDDSVLASGSMDGTIRVWNLSTAKTVATFEGHTGHVYAIVLSREGRYLVSGSMDKTVRVWSFPDGKPLAQGKGHEGTVSSLDLTASTRYIISGSYDSTVRLWDFQRLLQQEPES